MDAARVEFRRLLEDPKFQATERSRTIPSYLVQRRFEGHHDPVKAYDIAIDVLARPHSFDPADPIVRIEVGRVRTFLKQYYVRRSSDHAERAERALSAGVRGGGHWSDRRAGRRGDGLRAGVAVFRARGKENHSPVSALRGCRNPLFDIRYGAGGAVEYAAGRDRKASACGDHVGVREAARGRGERYQRLSAFGADGVRYADGCHVDRAAHDHRRPEKSLFGGTQILCRSAVRTIWWQVTDDADGHVVKNGVESTPTIDRRYPRGRCLSSRFH